MRKKDVATKCQSIILCIDSRMNVAQMSSLQLLPRGQVQS